MINVINKNFSQIIRHKSIIVVFLHILNFQQLQLIN